MNCFFLPCLTSVGVLSRVGHGEEAGRVVPQLEVLVLEGPGAVDGGDARAVVVDEVAALNHEVLDDAVEGGALVALRDPVSPVLAGAKLAKVLRGLRAHVCEDQNGQSTQSMTVKQ